MVYSWHCHSERHVLSRVLVYLLHAEVHPVDQLLVLMFISREAKIEQNTSSQ